MELRIRARVAHDLGVRGEPDALVAAHMADELFQDQDARAVADDMRMHGELEEAALAVRGIELPLEDVEYIRWGRVRPERREAVHVEVHRVVANPFHRQLDHAGRVPVHQELIAIDIGHQRRVVLETHLLGDGERLRAEVPRRRADADRPDAANLLQRVGGAHLQLSLVLRRQLGVALVDPAMDANLMTLGDQAALLLPIKERGDRGHEKARPDARAPQDFQDARDSLPGTVLPLREAPDRLAAIAQLVRVVIGIERERHGAAGAAVPAFRLERPPGAHLLDDAAPLLVLPLPGLQRAVVVHLAPALILRASSLMNPASCSTNRANSAGGMPTPSRPCASNCCFTSASTSAFTSSPWMRFTISRGAPAGSQRPNQLIRL